MFFKLSFLYNEIKLQPYIYKFDVRVGNGPGSLHFDGIPGKYLMDKPRLNNLYDSKYSYYKYVLVFAK